MTRRHYSTLWHFVAIPFWIWDGIVQYFRSFKPPHHNVVLERQRDTRFDWFELDHRGGRKVVVHHSWKETNQDVQHDTYVRRLGEQEDFLSYLGSLEANGFRRVE